MKHLLLFLVLLPLITACPPQRSRRSDVEKKFRENGYDIKPYVKHYYKKIRFQAPKMEVYYDAANVYRYNNAFSRYISELGIILTIEKFSDEDLASELMAGRMVEKDLLNAFHDSYVERRRSSLEQGALSFKKKVRANVKFPGVIQTVSGYRYKNGQSLYYVTATLEVAKEFYVFQYIAKEEMMAYVYDDFERILATVRKR